MPFTPRIKVNLVPVTGQSEVVDLTAEFNADNSINCIRFLNPNDEAVFWRNGADASVKATMSDVMVLPKSVEYFGLQQGGTFIAVYAPAPGDAVRIIAGEWKSDPTRPLPMVSEPKGGDQ